MNSKFIYSIHVDIDKKIREFDNNYKESILYNTNNQSCDLSVLKYRILYENYKLPLLDIVTKDMYTCILDINGRILDMDIYAPEMYVCKYNNTYIFENISHNKYIIVTVYKNKIIILNTIDHTLNLLDYENKSNNKLYTIDNIIFDENIFNEEFILRILDGNEYKFNYDKFGNINYVTKDNMIYSVRFVFDINKCSYTINTISPLLFILNKGIQIPDSGRIYYEDTTCVVKRDKVVDIVRKVYETSEQEYEKMIKQLIDVSDLM